MSSDRMWFLKLLDTLISDYKNYNACLQNLIEKCNHPLKSDLSLLCYEERRMSRNILNQEEIIAKWLENAELRESAELQIQTLNSIRVESSSLRHKSQKALEKAMERIKMEQQKSRNSVMLKKNTKETAPRLIDIKL